jgi:ribonuclease D
MVLFQLSIIAYIFAITIWITSLPWTCSLQDYNEVMELPEVTTPVWVDSQLKMQAMAVALSGASRIAVDTESNSMFAYQEQVCLVQISIPSADYLIDPLTVSDLSALAPVFANPAVEKIFHAAEYDLICLKRDYHFEFANLFDTMLAARILGITEVGLGSLLQNRFGVVLDKRYQRANWGRRPLTEEMLQYAALDTHYLFNLRDSLSADLKEKQLVELAEEDFRFISRVEGHGQNGNATNCWKVAGAHPITPQQAAVLDQLCQYRDQQARRGDLPHFKVFSNQQLLDLSISDVSTLEDISKVKGMSPGVLQRHGSNLLEAVQRGKDSKPIPKPRRTRLPVDYLQRIDRLKKWRKSAASEMKVESDVVLPRELMESIAYHHPGTTGDLSALMKDFPYRYRKYGQKILEILNEENLA